MGRSPDHCEAIGEVSRRIRQLGQKRSDRSEPIREAPHFATAGLTEPGDLERHPDHPLGDAGYQKR